MHHLNHNQNESAAVGINPQNQSELFVWVEQEPLPFRPYMPWHFAVRQVADQHARVQRLQVECRCRADFHRSK